VKRSYRIARRSFLAGIGGAFGLRVMLRNIEAAANEVPSPPRFLMTHWPVGTVKYHFLPSGSGTGYTPSRILQPFQDAGLRDYMTILYGLSMDGISAGCGGGHESGTPMMSTGANVPGTRANGGEADDGCAGGPSFDQIFLNRVPELQTVRHPGYINAICDARVDSQETSTQCLSYDYTMTTIGAARQPNCDTGGQLSEAVPLLPELSPVQLYMQLFGDFMPGEPADNTEVVRRLTMRQSVLDYAGDTLDNLGVMAPAAQKVKIEQHASVIRAVENQVADLIANGGGGVDVNCTLPAEPDGSLLGKTGSKSDYGSETTSSSDEELHRQIGEVHSSLIRAAFQCDIIRVATFQWSPGTNHVSFGGQFPDDPGAILMHHPLSHRIGSRGDVMDSPPNDTYLASVVEFLVNIQTWYNTQTANIINGFKDAVDVHGGNLLDYTIIPYVTEVAETTHTRSPIPALIFGGAALGMQHGQFLNFEGGGGGGRPWNDFWMTIAQAYLKTTDPVAALSDEVFVKQGVSPIDGLWTAPA
jgi:hypothetical protein